MTFFNVNDRLLVPRSSLIVFALVILLLTLYRAVLTVFFRKE